MFRTILAIICAVLYLLITLPVLVVLRIRMKKDPDAVERISRRMIQWIFRVFIRLSGMRLTVLGQEHVPADRAVLFISNHRSIFDIITTYPLLPRPVSYVAKKSLTKIPLFASWFIFIGSLFFDRNNLREGIRMLQDAMDKIRSGSCVFLFPEGTRSKGDLETPLLPFHEGSFRIAAKTGCPIIPIAITNMASVFDKQFPRLKPSPVIIHFGEPIDPASFSKAEQKRLGAYTSEVITHMLEEDRRSLTAG